MIRVKLRFLMAAAKAVALLLLIQTIAGGMSPEDAAEALPISKPAIEPRVAAGTAFSFHLNSPLSSNGSRKNERFSFTTSKAILADGDIVVPVGATGMGTVLLAGSAGSKGHEGDLTLRLDDVAALHDETLVFDHQFISIDGRNRKIASGALAFVPIAQFGAFFVRGNNVRIGTSTEIRTVLTAAGTLRPR